MRFSTFFTEPRPQRHNRYAFGATLPALCLAYCLVTLPGSGQAYAQDNVQNSGQNTAAQNGGQDTTQSGGGDEGGLIVGAVQGVPKIFLPNIGIAGDTAYERNLVSPNDPRHGSLPQQPIFRDGQFIANSRIDPFANAQLSIDLPNGSSANIEEAWLYFNKLPGGLAVRAGKFKPRFGLLDERDTFQLPMYYRPRALSDYLGDGLNNTGAQLDFVVPTPGDINLKAYLSFGRGDALGAQQSSSSIPLVYLATLDYARDLFETGSLELGASAAQGPSPYGNYEVLLDPYFQIQLAPSQRQVVTWSVEGMFAYRHDTASSIPSSRRSFYSFIDYNFALRYHVGFLVDWVQLPGPVANAGVFPDAFPGAPSDGSNVSLSPNFTWFVSDNTRLRFQYAHTTPSGSLLATDSFALQATFSMGNLKQLD